MENKQKHLYTLIFELFYRCGSVRLNNLLLIADMNLLALI